MWGLIVITLLTASSTLFTFKDTRAFAYQQEKILDHFGRPLEDILLQDWVNMSQQEKDMITHAVLSYVRESGCEVTKREDWFKEQMDFLMQNNEDRFGSVRVDNMMIFEGRERGYFTDETNE